MYIYTCKNFAQCVYLLKFNICKKVLNVHKNSNCYLTSRDLYYIPILQIYVAYTVPTAKVVMRKSRNCSQCLAPTNI